MNLKSHAFGFAFIRPSRQRTAIARPLPLLLAAALLFAACAKEKPEPDPNPDPTHIRVTLTGIFPFPYDSPVGCTYLVGLKLEFDSLPGGETPLAFGYKLLTGTTGEPTCADTIPGIETDLSADWNDLPTTLEGGLGSTFIAPGRTYRIRGYCRTSKRIYYSATVDYAPPSIAGGDDNVTELPVVFHLLRPDPALRPRNFSREVTDQLLAHANLALRDRIPHPQTPSADTRIRLVPVTQNPSGQPLSEPGLDVVKWSDLPIDPDQFLTTPTAAQMALCWDPNRYVNVWIFPYAGVGAATYAGMALLPYMPAAHPVEGLDNTDYYAYHPLDINPGITLNGNFVYGTDCLSTLAHEFGHTLGLHHAFSADGCGTDDDYCADTPDYDYAAFAASGNAFFESPRTGCDGSTFYSYNVMDYNGYTLAFTPDQNARMQQVLQYGYFTPGSETARRGRSAPSKAPAGLVRPTPRTIAVPANGTPFHTGADVQ